MRYRRESLTFDVLEFGRPGKETVILLHGFPEDAESLRPVAERVASAGYHVLIPEQRGYSSGARPAHRREYTLSKLVDDIAALLDAVDVGTAHIVGHDWGGVVAWGFASKYPERARSLVAVSSPHPQALIRSLWRSNQAFMARHMFFFQLSWIPERALTSRGGEKFRQLLVKSGLAANAAARYADKMQDRALIKGALNWYRALPFTILEASKVREVHAPTLFIYGQQDVFLSKRAATATARWVKGKYAFRQLPDATHWIPEESPTWLAKEILKFISKTPYLK